jgi:hypothetical protein
LNKYSESIADLIMKQHHSDPVLIPSALHNQPPNPNEPSSDPKLLLKRTDSWIIAVAANSLILRHSLSGINLVAKNAPTAVKSMGNTMAYELMQLSHVMSSCKGRDKICALIQYIVDLYVNCMKYSEEYHDLVE